jgi:hypothetical protein
MTAMEMTIKDMMNCVKALPKNISVLIRGPHGIGKSELVYWMGKNIFDMEVTECRLSQMSEGDVIGLPELTDHITHFCPVDWYVDCCKNPRVLFLDEINRATSEVMQAGFQIVLDRILNRQRLHPDTRIFAAVNINGSYQVNEMDPALLDRFFVIDLQPSVDEWLAYARSKIHSNLCNFVFLNPTTLHPTSTSGAGEITPSPRSWFRLNSALENAKILDVDLKEDQAAQQLFYCLSCGFVGMETAVKLVDYVKSLERQVTALDVLDNWEKNKKKIMDLGQEKWNICSEKIIEYMQKEVLTEDQCKNLGKYFDAIPGELRIVFWQTCAERHQEHPVITTNIKATHPYTVKAILRAANNPDEESPKKVQEAPAEEETLTTDTDEDDDVEETPAVVAPPPAKKTRAKKSA